jgi:hypothetical protein
MTNAQDVLPAATIVVVLRTTTARAMSTTAESSRNLLFPDRLQLECGRGRQQLTYAVDFHRVEPVRRSSPVLNVTGALFAAAVGAAVGLVAGAGRRGQGSGSRSVCRWARFGAGRIRSSRMSAFRRLRSARERVVEVVAAYVARSQDRILFLSVATGYGHLQA